MTYDHWKTTNPDDEFLGPRPRDIPADTERHPSGCPDADWCRGNRLCYWNCRDDYTGDMD